MAPPTYAGMTGRKLALSVSTVATMGFLLFGYDREFLTNLCRLGMMLIKPIEGVMSGIISDPSFNNMFTATKDDSTMQATVTAVYEAGM